MENLKKILFATIDYHTKGVDTYHNNGSMWLIFTDKKKWVIELTKEGTLWYNHYFFNDCFKYLSLDAVENQHYITEWVEDIIQNGVRSTLKYRYPTPKTLESIIQNGMKDTGRRGLPPPPLVESIIQNGVINTNWSCLPKKSSVDDTIQNGVINTFGVDVDLNHLVENTIQSGVKHIEPGGYLGSIEMKGKIVHQLESPKQNEEVEDVIENGIKEVKELPDQSGELKGYSDYYHRQEDITYPHTKTVNDVICNGIKKTNWRKVDNHPTYVDNVMSNNNF